MTTGAAKLAITAMTAGDWSDVARIYADGIASGDATFETEVPDWERFDRSHLPDHRLMAATEAGPVGWAALTPVSGRCVYAGMREPSSVLRSPPWRDARSTLPARPQGP